MKSIHAISTAIVLISTLTTAHAATVGFTGKHTFSFGGGNGNELDIVATAKTITLKQCSPTACETLYKGSNVNPLTTKDKTKYWFHDHKVSRMDGNKVEVSEDCVPAGSDAAKAPCVTDLF